MTSSPSSTPASPTPRPGVLDVAAYVAGQSHIEGVAAPVKMSANENALGCAPAARAAYAAASDRLHVYPDGGSTILREAIGRAHGLDPARIVCGAGSDELLQLLTRAYAGPGDEIIHTAHGFAIYRIFAVQAGATPVAVPETDLRTDVDAILAHVTDRTRIVFLANPNNPTGTHAPADALRRLHAGLPEHVLLVVDGAYAEYVERDDYESGLGLADAAPNVIATRTFSKIHGLSALRLGWAYGPPAVIDVLHRVRLPFNVNEPAIAAGAAAVGDAGFVARSRAHNEAERAYVAGVARQLGLLATESLGNFVLLRFSHEPGRTAADADAHLRRHGYILRGVAGYGLPDCLRMTIWTEEANRAVMGLLGEFLNPA